MPVFLVYLIIDIVLSAASYFIARNQASQAAKGTTQGFNAPTAQAGNPLPVFWGVSDVAPNTVWWGNLQQVHRHQWFYQISAHHILGWGVVNEIIDISFNGKSGMHWGYLYQSGKFFADVGGTIAKGPGTLLNAGAPLEFCVFGNHGGQSGSSKSMFGGDDQGGGVGGDDTNDQKDKGHMAMYWGFDDAVAQPLDKYLSGADAYGANCSRWPNMAYLRMGRDDGTPFYIAAGSGSPAQMKLLCRRTAWWDKGNTGALSPLGQTPAQATIRYDANPAEILYDILTHKGYGLGRDPASLDLASFAAVAATLRTETINATKTGFGISVTLTANTDAQTIIRNILQTIDATLATNPITGLLRLKLIRADYTLGDLPVLNASNTRDVRFSPGTWGNTINEMHMTYNHFYTRNDAGVDAANCTFGFVSDVATDQDLSNWQATGSIRTLTVDQPYITDPDVAQLVCARGRRALSVPLNRYSCFVNRDAFDLMKGDAVVAEEAAFGVSGLVLRILNIDYGTVESNEISVDLIQDVFDVTSSVYASAPTLFSAPAGTPTDNSGTGYSVRVPPDAPTPLWGGGF